MTSIEPAPAALPSLLTLVITTSPTPSAPSTDLISSVLLSFRSHCAGLVRCRVIVVFDTYDRVEEKARLKKGTVTAEGARAFAQYKDSVKELVLAEYQPDWASDGHASLIQERGSAEYGLGGEWNNVPLAISHTESKRVTFIEPSQRVGFGLAVRSALRITETPYVWIHQHDWALISDIPLEPMLDVMQASDSDETAPIRYICLPSVRMAAYAISHHVTGFPRLRALTSSLKRDFPQPSHPAAAPVPLTPLFFWHDKPHLASVAHYLGQVFSSRLAMQRGAFIEDTVGQRARGQMKDGVWARWACWLYYPDDGRRLCVRHLNGRTWKGAEFELQMRQAVQAKRGQGGQTRKRCDEQVAGDRFGAGAEGSGGGETPG